MTSVLHTRLRLVACALAMLLGGCMHTSKADFMRHYTLSDSTAAAFVQRTSASAPARHMVLYIAPIAAPPWLQGTQMFYRLDYRHDARLAAYAHSDWIAPPATLLEVVVRHAAAATGDWQAVIGSGEPVGADTSLHIRLDDFSQDFAQPDHSRGVLSATATLVDNNQGSVLGQKSFHIRVDAASANARGGAMALDQASRQFAVQLDRWLQLMVDQERGRVHFPSVDGSRDR